MKPRPVHEEPPFAFLGEEFLLWLWHHCETADGSFELPDGGTVGVALDDFLCLGDANPDETEQTLKRGLPTRSAEATAALQAGKRVKRARLVLAEDGREWSVVLDHELKLRSVRCEADEKEEAGDLSAARIAGFLRLTEVVDGLYQRFLTVRLVPGWQRDTAARIRKWVGAR
jgi:hypothetical protein